MGGCFKTMSPLELLVAKLHIWRYKPQLEAANLIPMVPNQFIGKNSSWVHHHICFLALHIVILTFTRSAMPYWSDFEANLLVQAVQVACLNFHISVDAVFFWVLLFFFLPFILAVPAPTKGKVHITLVAIRSAISVKMPFHKWHPQVNFQILQSDPVGCPNRDQLLGIEVTFKLAAAPRS